MSDTGPMVLWFIFVVICTASSEFGTYSLCEQRRFRRACASEQSRQNLRCSLIQAVSQEEPSDRKPDLWPLWMAGHAQLKFVMTECSKTQIRLTGLICDMLALFCVYFQNVWINRLGVYFGIEIRSPFCQNATHLKCCENKVFSL